MELKCKNCGFVLEAVLGEGDCPKCGRSKWYALPEKKIKEGDMVSLAKEFLRVVKEEGIKIIKKEGVPENPYLPKDYKENIENKDLAFEIFEVEDGKKVKVRKIYLNGHIEGFEGDPCIVNYAYPKFMQLKAIIHDMLRQINKNYRDFIEKHLLAGLPIDPIEFSKFYQAQLERIMDIKI